MSMFGGLYYYYGRLGLTKKNYLFQFQPCCIAVKPVLGGHPWGMLSYPLIQGVHLIQDLIDNVVLGVKCHSNMNYGNLQENRQIEKACTVWSYPASMYFKVTYFLATG